MNCNNRINSQIRVKVHTEDCGSRGSINADQARTYAQIAEAEAKKAKYYADLIEENIKTDYLKKESTSKQSNNDIQNKN